MPSMADDPKGPSIDRVRDELRRRDEDNKPPEPESESERSEDEGGETEGSDP